MRLRRSSSTTARTASPIAHRAFDDLHRVQTKALGRRLGVDDLELEALRLDRAGIAHFAAHFGIKRREAQTTSPCSP